jgi:hypothetical protein
MAGRNLLPTIRIEGLLLSMVNQHSLHIWRTFGAHLAHIWRTFGAHLTHIWRKFGDTAKFFESVHQDYSLEPKRRHVLKQNKTVSSKYLFL